jgi:hypothetical protein
MPDVERISAEDARRRAAQGALLVCAYDDDQKCGRVRLEGALTMGELRGRLDTLPRDQEIIFYCT